MNKAHSFIKPKNHTSNRGFTLIEFISVVTAACISISLLAPQFISHLNKSYDTVCLFNSKQVVQSYEIAKIDCLSEGKELSLEEFISNCSDCTDTNSDEAFPIGVTISVNGLQHCMAQGCTYYPKASKEKNSNTLRCFP